MLYLDQTVPDHLILPIPVEDLESHLRTQGADWFRAAASDIQTQNDAVTKLNSATSGASADQSQPNDENARFVSGDQAAISFEEANNCGFCRSDLKVDANQWSMAIRLSPQKAQAKTLLTLNPDTVENYAFLMHSDGQILFKDQKSTFEVSCPSQVPSLVIAGISNGRACLRVDTDAICHTDALLDLGETQNLFIGCRSNRPGLMKTLGTFALRDVILWPTLNVLDPGQRETLKALDDDALWGH